MDMIEQKTAETILQKPFEVQAGGKTYAVARPTFGTLIELSPYVKQLPNVTDVKKEDLVPYILSIAEKYGKIIAKMAALLIIGGQNIVYHKVKRLKSRFLCFKRYENVMVSNVDELADELIRNASSEEMNRIINLAMGYQDIGFFLSTIISLSAANVLEATQTEATAFGG